MLSLSPEMTTDMASPPRPSPNTSMAPPPPPPRKPTTTSNTTEPLNKTLDEPSTSTSQMKITRMGPPPPKTTTTIAKLEPEPPVNDEQQQEPPSNSSPIDSESTESPNENSTPELSGNNSGKEQIQKIAVPYSIPPWSEPPCHRYSFEVLKDGSIVDQLDVYEKGAYMFGRVDLCDFVLEHPTISRFHAVVQFKRNGEAYLYDLGSTHGSSINKNQVKKKAYVELHVGDVIRFGNSSRLYIFQGPSELMPPERDLKSVRSAKMREERKDMEASLLRAKREAFLADGISWGMDEDAVEEAEEDVDEITWQSYKGQLTERQEKTREKVIKRLEKIANMKKEIDAIRVKDISQGGLTQGQQTQIARNEQRIAQVLEELENLEETLNESIRESLGARGGRTSRGKAKGATEEEEEYMSDEDDFYDRTKKPSNQKVGENKTIETADSLLDKKDAIVKEMEEKKKLIEKENERVTSEKEKAAEAGDALDAYMSGLSSQLVLDNTERLQMELSSLQSELDRILYLMNIADPTGEVSRKRQLRAQEPKPGLFQIPNTAVSKKQPPLKHIKESRSEKTASGANLKRETSEETKESSKMAEEGVVIDEKEIEKPKESSKKPEEGVVVDAKESKTTVYTVAKPQWLGAIEEVQRKETQVCEAPVNLHEPDQFVDYKDRDKVLGNVESGIENAAPGLIIRKRKQVEKLDANEVKSSEEVTSSSLGVETRAEDAVALLLKHTKGIYASDEHGSKDMPQGNQPKEDHKKPKEDNKKPRRVLGPERPSFLDSGSELETWVPPKGQSGDGRTSLNDRYGY